VEAHLKARAREVVRSLKQVKGWGTLRGGVIQGKRSSKNNDGEIDQRNAKEDFQKK